MLGNVDADVLPSVTLISPITFESQSENLFKW